MKHQVRGRNAPRRATPRRRCGDGENLRGGRAPGLDAGGIAQCIRLVSALPAEAGLGAAEVAVGRGREVHRAQQVEHLYDALGTQVKMFDHEFGDLRIRNYTGAEGVDVYRNRFGDADGVGDLDRLYDALGTQVKMFDHEFGDLRIRNYTGAEGVDVYRNRFGDADGVGDLDLATRSQPGGDDILGDVAPGISGRAVDLGRVLAGEGAAAVTGHAAVGVDNDLAAGQAGVTHRAADLERAGRVDEILGVLAEPFLGQHRFHDFLDHGLLEGVVLDARCMLGREHDRVDAGRLVVHVFHGDLRLGVRAQPIEFAFTQIGLALHQAMRQRDRHGHEHVGLAGGIAEHQALVAGALLEIEALALVHAGGDIGRLAADGGQHRAAVRAEAHLVGVTDVAHHVARHLVEIHVGLGRDLAREHHQVVLDQRLARHARGLVLRQDGVQHGVRDLVTDLVRMTFRYRFRGKKKTVRHKKQPRSG